jgi:hypothetical protein
MFAAPQSKEDFEEMLSDARETEVSLHFSTGALSTLENHPHLDRAVKHGLVEAGLASITSRISIESAEVQWTWPVSPYVNYAQIQIKSPRKTISHEIQRKPGKLVEDRKLNLPGGGDVQIDVITGVRSPSGIIILAPEKLRHSISIPAAPYIPDAPKKRQASSRNGNDDDDASFYDAEVQKRNQELAEIARHKAKQKKILASCAAAILLPLSGFTYFQLTQKSTLELCRNISLEKIGKCRYDISGQISSASYFNFSGSEYLLVYSDKRAESVGG